jgi:hypothetical protein
MIDFRNRSSWRNYGKSIHRGDDKELIKYKVDTFNYISKLEAQIGDLQRQITELIRGTDDDVK